MPILQDNYVICHLVTTGKDPLKDEILETGLVKINQNEILAKVHYYSKPSGKLPLRVKTLTGLTDDFLQAQPRFEELLPDILNFIGEAELVCSEPDLIYAFLSAAAGHPLPNAIIDSSQLTWLLMPGSNAQSLKNLYQSLFNKRLTASGAGQIALAQAEVFLKLCTVFKQLNTHLLVQMSNVLSKADNSVLTGFIQQLTNNAIKNFSFHKMSEDSAENILPESIHEDSQSLFYEAKEEPADVGAPLSEEQVSSILGPGGNLARRHPRYEYRPQQLKMAEAVTKALNEDQVLLTEAGTGTGKSMAYLIPAVLWAVQNNKKIVIATHTINLQEQLWYKDIPLLKEISGTPFRAALIKGRQNYLCLKRWSESLAVSTNYSGPEAMFYCRILVWLSKTKTGDRSEINLSGKDYDMWVRISADSDNCSGPHCRWFHGKCFVTRAKKLAEKANLIIVNHSLLCSDVQSENRILPTYGPLIIDEAHHLESVATDHFGCMVSETALKQWLLGTEKLVQKLAQFAVLNSDSDWDQKLILTRRAENAAHEAAESFFKLYKAVFSYPVGSSEKSLPGGNVRRLFHSEYLENENMSAAREDLLLNFKILIGCLRKLLLRVEVWVTQYERWDNIERNLSNHLNLGNQFLANLEFILWHRDETYVYWMEANNYLNKSTITLKTVPINVGLLLYEKIFKHKKPVILTSATLSIEGSFDYFKNRIGLDQYSGKIQQLQIDSPFNYQKQVQLYLNYDLPNQNEVPEQFYHSSLANIIEKLVTVTQGKSLVLFTSHYTLRETYRILKPELEAKDILLLGHNIDGSPSGLIEEFKHTRRCVLFGTSSFWEGVDIPGESLSSVIIVKLPFWSPSVPVIEARLEYLASQGKRGFWEYSLPQAVIRFKQGFGRLIRSSRDHGVVIVLDKRIIEKKYGRYFLNSLPLKYHLRGKLNLLLPKINCWMETHKA